MWNSPSSVSDQSRRCSPRWGRCSSSFTPSISMHNMESVELHMNTSQPDGLRRRAASGIHLYGSAQIDAPYSECTMSNDASGKGTSSPTASISGNSMRVSRCMRRAVANCAGVGSMPTGRAPRFAIHAEKYAVPHPSSTTSRPSSFGKTRSSDSGMRQIPHVISSCAHDSAARASVYSAFARVQLATFCATYSGNSDELIVCKPQVDLALRRLRRIGTVDEVVRHCERQVAADRARICVRGIRRADRLAQRRDCALPFDDERERGAGSDELDELPEERFLLVLVVVPFGEIARHANQLARVQRAAATLDAREDLAGKSSPDCVGLDENQGSFQRHRARESTQTGVAVSTVAPRTSGTPPQRPARPAFRSTGRSATAPRAAPCSSRTPASTSSCTPDTRGNRRRPPRDTPGSAGHGATVGPPSHGSRAHARARLRGTRAGGTTCR